jgi:dienelactone hydrolase
MTSGAMSDGRTEIRFPSGDGECAAWWYKPAGRASSACVVLGHGFTATRHEGLDLYARQFAAAGLAALAFDYRHFGDSPGEPRQHCRVRNELEDWRSALAFARSRPEVEGDRLVAWGFSLGGGLVASIASRGERLAAIMLNFPFLDGRARARGVPLNERRWILRPALLDLCGRRTLVPVAGPPGSRAIFNRPGELEGLERVISDETPNEVLAGCMITIAPFAPVRRAAKVTIPAWIALGERDISVDRDDIERFASRAPRAELHRYPYDHFDALLEGGARRVAGDQIEFLRRQGVLNAEEGAKAREPARVARS